MSGLRGAGIHEAILNLIFRFFVFTDVTFAAELDISLFLIYWYSLAVEA